MTARSVANGKRTTAKQGKRRQRALFRYMQTGSYKDARLSECAQNPYALERFEQTSATELRFDPS